MGILGLVLPQVNGRLGFCLASLHGSRHLGINFTHRLLQVLTGRGDLGIALHHGGARVGCQVCSSSINGGLASLLGLGDFGVVDILGLGMTLAFLFCRLLGLRHVGCLLICL